jgi:hypothetical protein
MRTLHILMPVTGLLPFADPEDEASDDEVLASYREEPACEVTTVLDSLRRSGSSLRSSVLGVAPVDYVTSTPRPSHQAFAAPAPMTVNRDLDLACSAADYRSRLSASTSSAANQTSISSSSANLSASFVRPPDPLDDMFERRKRDLNRNSGIHVDEELLDIPFLPPPGYIFLSIDERPMVRLPVRASGGLGEGPTSRQERDEMPPPPPRPRASNVVPLSSSVIGLTLPREFNFAKPAPPPGMSARERSAARAEEVSQQAFPILSATAMHTVRSAALSAYCLGRLCCAEDQVPPATQLGSSLEGVDQARPWRRRSSASTAAR